MLNTFFDCTKTIKILLREACNTHLAALCVALDRPTLVRLPPAKLYV